MNQYVLSQFKNTLTYKTTTKFTNISKQKSHEFESSKYKQDIYVLFSHESVISINIYSNLIDINRNSNQYLYGKI